jgi:hypothetical protein
LVFNVVNVLFDLQVLKGKPIMSKGTMPHLKLSKNMFWDKKFEKQKKITTHMDL